MNTLITLLITLLVMGTPTQNINFKVGEFYHEIDVCDPITYEPTVWYQFRSDDDAVWWSLDEMEIGHIPTMHEGKYLLIFDDNGTKIQREFCDCLEEWDCECHLYDDELVTIIQLY